MSVEISLIISQMLAFLVMVWLLKRFAWRPLLKILAERKQKISAEFSAIEEKKRQLESLQETYRGKLNAIEEEYRKKVAEAVEAGAKLAQKIQEDAHNQAKQILQKAQSDIQHEVVKAQALLKQELVNSVMFATEKLLEKKLDPEKDRQLIENLIEKAHMP